MKSSEETLAEILDLAFLQRMAGERTYGRGLDYFEGGLARSVAEEGGRVTATVRGTRRYRVGLWVDSGKLGYSCTCPVGAEGRFCKHAVAVGLEWLTTNEPTQVRKGRRKEPAVTMNDVSAYLRRQDKETLVKLLIDHAMDEERLRDRLLMKAAKDRQGGIDLDTFRKTLDRAIDPGGFIDYRSAYEYARGIEEVIDSIGELLEEGSAAEVVALAEHGLSAVEDCIGSIDDSDGHMRGILELLQELHHEACREAKPDLIELAERLFAWELRTEWDVFYGAASTYKDVLGKRGIARYRELAEEEWRHVPPLKPGSKDPNRFGKRFRITHIMETLAREEGDTEALVAAKSRDLSHAYAYLQIAEIYRGAGNREQALEWAERGVAVFPERTDSRLREFLADEYHSRERHDDALSLIWAGFIEAPYLEQYRNLNRHAVRAEQWPEWRSKALAFVRSRVEQRRSEESKRTESWWSPRGDHSDLVSIFLWEGDADTAWREAKEGGCSEGLWMQLAELREEEHPEDGIPIYQRHVEATIEQKNRDGYREAVRFLKKLQQLMSRADQQRGFATYLEGLRAAHKRKRNFIKLVDAVKWNN